MKKILIFCALALVVVLAGCGGGGSGSSSSDSGTNADGSVTKTLSVSNESTAVGLDGEDGDKLSLSIPSLPVGSSEIEVNFKLVYNDGSSLPSLVIDKDIEFLEGVSFTFKSSSLKDGEYALVYVSDSGEKYTVPYTQDGDTLTATLSHFSQYQVVPAPSQPNNEANVEVQLSSWEANNRTKKMEEVGMNSIKSLLANINRVTDSTKREAFLKRFEDALLVLAHNSLEDWRSSDMEYFTKYCMTQEFRVAIIEFTRLYSLFDKFGTSNDNIFNMLKDEIIKIVENHYFEAQKAWVEIDLPKCDAIDTPAYVKCAYEFDRFVEITSNLYFDGRASEEEDVIMDILERQISIVVTSMMQDGDDCDCLLVYKNVLVEYYSSAQSELISEINEYMSGRCSNSCAYIWNIDFTQNFVGNESGEPLQYVTNISFRNVFIYPRSDYTLTNKETESCAAYLDEYGKAKNIIATSYDAVEGTDNHYLQGPPIFNYAGLKPDGLYGRDPKYDVAFNKLDAAYIAGKDAYDNGNSWDGWAYLGSEVYHPTVFRDIFEEIYLHKAFAVGDSKGTFIFTPVGLR